MERVFFRLGAVLAFLAVAAGAFGAHAVRPRLSPDLLDVFETAARYHFFHALGLIVAGFTAARWPGTAVHLAGWLFLAGIILFSGSLYLLSLTGVRWLGAITPLGGLAFLAGWLCLAWAGWRG